ncbi:Hypothetical protein AJF4211_000270 [Avibacterium paragallinarum JF4211]|nr:Hypothetical protein AJF4211_000270 [Avibacterium paragallinarum JF4211]
MSKLTKMKEENVIAITKARQIVLFNTQHHFQPIFSSNP